jgi:hypothetical protein
VGWCIDHTPRRQNRRQNPFWCNCRNPMMLLLLEEHEEHPGSKRKTEP